MLFNILLQTLFYLPFLSSSFSSSLLQHFFFCCLVHFFLWKWTVSKQFVKIKSTQWNDMQRYTSDGTTNVKESKRTNILILCVYNSLKSSPLFKYSLFVYCVCAPTLSSTLSTQSFFPSHPFFLSLALSIPFLYISFTCCRWIRFVRSFRSTGKYAIENFHTDWKSNKGKWRTGKKLYI